MACSVAWAGCVVVSDPNVEVAGTTGTGTGESSAGPVVVSSASESTASTSTGAAGDSESGEAPPIAAGTFEVLWTVSPSSVVPPRGSAGTIRTDAFTVASVDYGSHPGAFEDRETLYAEIEAGIETAIPDGDAAGFGVLPRPGWIPAWCDSSDAAKDGFAASALGDGLSGAELESAYEAAALEILLEVLTRARAARPNVAWGIRGVPSPEYWRIVQRNEDATYEPWRTCNVSSPAPRELWEAVDFTAPELRYFYSVRDDGSYNASYVTRWVEAMRLANKPVYPLFDGRFLRSSDEDDSIYIGLPYYPEDIELVLTELRNAGADGLIYNLDADACWDLDADCSAAPPADLQAAVDDYWMTAFSPVLATFDEM